MVQKDFAAALAERSQTTKAEANSFIESFADVLKKHIVDMDSIAIPGFGTFEPRKRLEKITVHPSSGKRILMPPKITINFKMSTILKQKLRGI